MRIRIALLTLGLLALLAVPAAAQSGNASVTVVHGIPGVPVDVYVNDEPTLTAFQPGTITDPLSLPAGSYQIDVRAAGDPADAEPVISASADVPGGANASLVAHLSAEGEPTLTPFVNDVSGLDPGQGRVTVRHTAAAPAVDVLVGGQPALTGLSNPNEASAELPAGTIEAAVALAGTAEPVLGPADVTVTAGSQIIVYAIGSAEEGSLDLLVQTVAGQAAAPHGVPSGDGGAAAPAAPPVWLVAGAAVGAVAALAAARRLASIKA